MATGFETYLRTLASLGDSVIERIVSVAKRRTLQRNEMLLQQGQVCRYKTFVEKGLLRMYGTVADGSEHILYFAPENNWVVDGESYDNHTPSRFNIAAIERSEIVIWAKADFDQLLKDIPGLSAFSQQLISRSNYNGRQRLFTTLSTTPEERYEDFVKNFPDLLARLPLHMIAAYLGISLKTLTRIRHAQVRR